MIIIEDREALAGTLVCAVLSRGLQGVVVKKQHVSSHSRMRV